MLRLNNTIVKPLINEKAVDLSKENKYSFRVNLKASKGSISNEIESMYGVTVIAVNTCIVPGKKKRILKTRRFTKTSGWKKAIVQLKEGQKIEAFNL